MSLLAFLLVATGVQAQSIAGNAEKLIALTFDDGPDAQATPALLDVLKQHDAKATFFVLGNRISSNRLLVERIDQEGHELGNHTMSHTRLTSLDEGQVRAEIEGVNAALRQITGKTPAVFRPPYVALDAQATRMLREYGLAIASFSINSGDSGPGSAASISANIVSNAKDGDIVFLHDTAQRSVDATEMAIRELAAQGFRFVTVSQLMSRRGAPVPGAIYRNGYQAE